MALGRCAGTANFTNCSARTRYRAKVELVVAPAGVGRERGSAIGDACGNSVLDLAESLGAVHMGLNVEARIGSCGIRGIEPSICAHAAHAAERRFVRS